MTPENIKQLRDSIAAVQKFQSAVASLESDRDRLVQAANLDSKAREEFAQVSAGLTLAAASAHVIRNRAQRAAEVGLESETHALNAIQVTHDAIEAAIVAKVISSVVEELRAGIDPKKTKPYLAEKEARQASPTATSVYVWEKSPIHDIQDALDRLLSNSARVLAEQERVASVAKKLGVKA